MPHSDANGSSQLSDSAIFERLRALVTERLDIRPENLAQLNPDLPIIEGLQLDSLAQVTLMAGIEDEFGIELEPEDRERIHTVRDLTTIIQQRASANV